MNRRQVIRMGWWTTLAGGVTTIILVPTAGFIFVLVIGLVGFAAQVVR